MLHNIIAFSIKNKFIIGLFTLVLIAYGSYSITQLPIDALPDITNNQVQIITSAPSLAAQEVEQFITYPIEQSVKIIPKIVELRSISRFGLSVVTVVFEENVDVFWARAQISERIKDAESEIPPGVGTPDMAPISTGLGEIYQYVIYPDTGFEDKYNAIDLRTIQDWIIKPQLTGIEGVAEISSLGGLLKQYEVAIDPDKLRSMNTTISEIFGALEHNNENTGGAYIDKQPYAYFIRGVGMAEGIGDIENIVVKNVNGIPLLIKDVATVQEGSSIRYGAVTKDGNGEVVGGMVLMLKGENSSEVVRRVKEKVEEIRKTLPEGIVMESFIDRTDLVDKAIGTVEKNLLEGALIVIFILVLLIGNFRAGLLVASVIPLAMLFAVILMNLFGVSGNLMSLGAIDFGLIIDGAVIIVESVVHVIAAKKLQGRAALTQHEMDETVTKSASKLMNSATFGQVIILIVYLPILSLVGIEGKMFKPMAQTVSFAILGAIILSITYVPMMSALVLSKKTVHKKNISDKILDFLHRIYEPLLKGALRVKWLVIAIAAGLFGLALIVYQNLGAEFIPTLEEGDLATHIIIIPGSSLSQEIETTTKAEKIIRENFPEVLFAVSRIGSAEIPTDPMPMEAADMIIGMKDKDEWVSAKSREEMMEKMEEKLKVLPGVTLEFTQPIQMRFNELMTGVRSDVAIKIFGEDLDLLAAKANELTKLIGTIKGIEDLRAEQVTGLPQIAIKYNKEKLALYGLNVVDLNRVIRTAFAGETAGTIYEGEKRFDLVVRLQGESREDIGDVKNMFISLPSGNQIPLSQVADVEFEQGPMQISREEGKRRIVIGFNVRGRDVKTVVDEIQTKLDSELKLPPGYYITYGGQFENLVDANKRLSVAVPVALLLILILLYFTFRSVKYALLIFTAIPLSAIGGVFALWVRDMPFSISAGVGFIALFGVAVLNGIVLISYFNQLKKEGENDVIQRILRGTKVRLRPVIMTAAVASLGFLPMALSNSAGAEVQKPLATVVIGGLITATFLTLIVLPVLYILFERGIKRKMKPSAATLAIIFILFAGHKMEAQNVLTLDKAFETAANNNLQVQSSALNIELQNKLKQTSGEIPKTDIEFEYSPVNDLVEKGWDFSVEQQIPFPTLFSARSQLGNAQIKGGEYQLAVSLNELQYQVHMVFDKIVYLQAYRNLLRVEDSLLTEFVRAAGIRYDSGESNLLEKLTSETQQKEIQNQLFQNQSAIEMEKSNLKLLMNDYTEFEIVENMLNPITLDAMYDTSLIRSNPLVNYYMQQVIIAEKQKKVLSAEQLPEFSFGYYNTNVIGVSNVNGTEIYYDGQTRYQGIKLGINIPLWFKPSAAKVQAAEITRQLSAYESQSSYLQLTAQFQQAVNQYNAYKHSVDYYQLTALGNASKIVNNAAKAYKSGEADYIEYLQALQTNLMIQNNYLDALNNLNQSVITIQFLLNI